MSRATPRRYRPSHATVVAYLALFIALGGSSYAAVTLKRNSVKGKHIARNAITSPKVANGRLLAEDFAPGQLPGGEVGPPGPQGERGPQGARGPQGPAEGPAGGDLSGSYPNPTLRPAEGWHNVGSPNEPQFDKLSSADPDNWANYGGVYNSAGFYKDRAGVVRLKGLVRWVHVTIPGSCPSVSIFTLPPGYRPAATEIRTTLRGEPNRMARVDIGSDGSIRVCHTDEELAANDWILLDGITFRAAQ